MSFRFCGTETFQVDRKNIASLVHYRAERLTFPAKFPSGTISYLFLFVPYVKQSPLFASSIHARARSVIDLDQREGIFMDVLKQMQKLALFQGVPAEKLKALAERALYRTYKASEILIGEKDPARTFYVVVTGQVKLYKISAEGKEQTLNLLGPGEPFGMCTAFAIESFPANVMALEESGILLIPGPVMEAIAMKEPRLLLNIIRLLSDRLKESMILIESLALKEIPQRIASFLIHALTREGEQGVNQLELKVTQRELAKILGATPEALSRALRKMSNAGVLAVDGRSIRILDREALGELAEGD
jgi:CRP/FNR family transcriptional regulator, dissimilatory nitrate respiration regulator